MDSDGIDLELLAHALDSGTQNKFLYINPSFQNPAGILYSRKRREDLLALLRGRDIMLLEDDPYSELYFDENDLPATVPIKAIDDTAAPICYVGSFAKILGPGMRLGWLCAPAEIVDKVELAKQSMDACSSSFTQVLAHAFLSRGKLQPYLIHLRDSYRRRAQLMLDTLKNNLPDTVSWTVPRGGFYVWVTLPRHCDSKTLWEKSIAQGAAFVPGYTFDPEGVRNDCFRLAFSHTPEEKIKEGVEIICSSILESL
jgi:hypothetical protein